MSNEQNCRQAFDDFYHKIKAEVSYDHWCAIWRFISKRQARGEPVAWEFSHNGYWTRTSEPEMHKQMGRPVRPLYAAPQPADPDVLPGEAVFGFAAWLTSLKAPVTLSECHGAAIGADLAVAYNKSQGFDEIREDFHKRLKPYPEQEPAQPAEPVRCECGPVCQDTGGACRYAEPVKVDGKASVPSDEAIQALAKQYDCHLQGFMGFARALLARYVQPADPSGAQDGIHATQTQQIPEGYALVPLEPTQEMLKSGWAENDMPLKLRWKAMINAAPKP